MIRVVLEHMAKDQDNADMLVRAIDLTRNEARKQRGFITGETLIDVKNPLHIVVISSWQTEEDWKVWDRSAIRISLLPLLEEHLSEPYTENTMKDSVIWKEDITHVF